MELDSTTIGTIIGSLVAESVSETMMSVTTESGVNPMMAAVEVIIRRLGIKPETGFGSSAVKFLVEKHDEMGYRPNQWIKQALILAPYASERYQSMLFAPCMKDGSLEDVIKIFEITGESLSEDDVARMVSKVRYGSRAQESEKVLLGFIEGKRPDLLDQARKEIKILGELEDDIPF